MGATFHRYQERLFVIIGKHRWFLGVLSAVGIILWDVQTWSGINTNIASNMYRMEIIQAVGVILLLTVLLFFRICHTHESGSTLYGTNFLRILHYPFFIFSRVNAFHIKYLDIYCSMLYWLFVVSDSVA